jgi:hypothetical protein
MLSPAVLLGEGWGNSAAQLDRYAPDPLNATYLIDGVAVPLRDGRHEEGAAPGSAAMIRTSAFGQSAYGDIDGEGDEDVAVFSQGNCKSDLIYIESPLPGTHITSPLRIRGYARGKWLFEGDFPVVLTDSGGKVIAKGYATAKDDWMTDKFVLFESEIKFKMPSYGNRGTLILKKDNPTDRPEHDDELEIAVVFFRQDSMGADPWQKITFDIFRLDESGLYGQPDGKRALSYEFCIPDTVQNRSEVKRIDPTVKFFAGSPGRIGCKEHENLCIGSTHQKDFRGVLQRLAELTYVQRIDESFFE